MFLRIVALLLPCVALICGLAPIFILASIIRKRRASQKMSSPLREMLRPPGYSLQKRIEDISGEIDFLFILTIGIPLYALALYLADSHIASTPDSSLRIAVTAVAGFGLLAVAIRKLWLKVDELQKYRLGMEGEMFTGEALNQLMLCECRVFHDIVYPYGNIDHVVVSSSGIFSVNSKAFRKPTNADSVEVDVDYGENVIRFPHMNYRIPQDALETESNWLAKHLSGAIGEPVEVEAMLALPGWWIRKRTGRTTVCVLNPVNAQKWFVHRRTVHPPERIQRIAHQLEQQCRDVEPSYRDDTSWENTRAETGSN